MLDKHAQYSPAVRWTANGPVRVTRRPVHLSLWQRFIKWLEG